MLGRLLMALTIAVCWLCLIADPEAGVLPANWNASVVTWGKASIVLLALVYLDDCLVLPRLSKQPSIGYASEIPNPQIWRGRGLTVML